MPNRARRMSSTLTCTDILNPAGHDAIAECQRYGWRLSSFSCDGFPIESCYAVAISPSQPDLHSSIFLPSLWSVVRGYGKLRAESDHRGGLHAPLLKLQRHGIGTIFRQSVGGLLAVVKTQEYQVVAAIVQVGNEGDDTTEVGYCFIVELRAAFAETEIERQPVGAAGEAA